MGIQAEPALRMCVAVNGITPELLSGLATCTPPPSRQYNRMSCRVGISLMSCIATASRFSYNVLHCTHSLNSADTLHSSESFAQHTFVPFNALSALFLVTFERIVMAFQT